METLARILIFLGLALVVIGGVVLLLGRAGLPIGRLPGDFRFQTDGFSCFLPIGTSILLSIILSVLLTLFSRFFR
jgi:hypothetical protein